MNDLTVVFYTANRIGASFAGAVMNQLRVALAPHGNVPIVAVTQGSTESSRYLLELSLRPVRLIDVGDQPPSIAQVYRNILLGCESAFTPYVAFCEDDTLYTPEHFTHRPAADVFAYNENRVVISRRLSADGRRREAFYYYRPRTQMAMGLCARELMIETLREKFLRYPDPPLDTTVAKKSGWGEPGRYEKNLDLTPRALERFKWTVQPNVTFNHGGLMGRRRVNPDDQLFDRIEPWGEANALWERIHG